MKPIDAWHIISANLCELYKLRRSIHNEEHGFTDAEIEAEVICFSALKDMEERGADNE